jgi:hypothetical protein
MVDDLRIGDARDDPGGRTAETWACSLLVGPRTLDPALYTAFAAGSLTAGRW